MLRNEIRAQEDPDLRIFGFRVFLYSYAVSILRAAFSHLNGFVISFERHRQR